jgi:hypothetical protein
MTSRTLPRRLATGALLLCTAAALAACTSANSPGASGSTGPTPGGATATGGPASGAPGTPCDLLTASDVQTVLSEGVTASNGSAGASASDGSAIAQCVLSTDGPALLGGNAQSILAFVAGLTGQQPTFNLKTGGIAVIVATTATPVTASATGAPLPSGGSAASGIGKSAYAIPSPTGGGIAVSQVDDHKEVVVVDLEGKPVTADQLTALLKAAVDRA